MRRLVTPNIAVLMRARRMRGGGMGFGLYGFGIMSSLGKRLLAYALSKGKDAASGVASKLVDKAREHIAERLTGSGVVPAATASDLKKAAAIASNTPSETINPLASVVGGKGMAASKRKSTVDAASKALAKQSAATTKKQQAAMKRLAKAQADLEGMGLYMLGESTRQRGIPPLRRAPAPAQAP